jgi:hypothetical protein
VSRKQVGLVRGTWWLTGSARHGGKNSETKSWTVSWLSLKPKLEPIMSGNWWRLHRVRGVSSGSPENHWVTRLRHKAEAIDMTRRCGHPGRFNRPGGRQFDRRGRCRREASKRRTHFGIARLALKSSKVAVAGHPSDGENLKTSKFALEGHVSLVI